MKLYELLKPPFPYEPSTRAFWDDPYIAKNMLAFHLDPNEEAASRKLKTIHDSVAFMTDSYPPTSHRNVLDLGCGPGLYANLFEQAGYQVTGIDLSKSSIEYAQSVNPRVSYHVGNYLDLDAVEAYDLIVLIYCDFAVLKPTDRNLLLSKIHRALKKEGVFLFDVFTTSYVERLEPYQSWSHEKKDGFFSPKPHLLFSSRTRYPNFVFGEQYVLLEETGQSSSIHVWNQGFTPKMIDAELEGTGLKRCALYQDFTGNPYDPALDTIMVTVTKDKEEGVSL